jgi:hypothetical protein
MIWARKRRASKVQLDIQQTRTELALLRARYDSGAVNAAVYAVIKRIECDIAWNEHKQERTTQIGRAAP